MPHWQEALAQQGDAPFNTLKLATPPQLMRMVEGSRTLYLRSQMTLLPDGTLLLVAQSLKELQEMHEELLLLILVLILLMVGAGIIGGWWIGRTVVTSLDQVL